MAVLSVNEDSPPTSSVNLQGERTYTRTFRVETTSPETGPRAVIAALGVAKGTTYAYGLEADPGAVCLSIDVSPSSDDGCSWQATVQYGPWPASGPVAENPLLQPPDISFSHREFEVPVERDRLGNPIVNSAGDMFNPTATRDDSRLLISIARNEATAPLALMAAIRNTVNQSEVVIPGIGTFAPRTLKAIAPQATLSWHPDVPGFAYWKVTYQFEVNTDEVFASDGTTLIAQGWDTVLLDVGFRYLEEDDEVFTRKLVMVDGEPAQDPVPLDGEGQVLDPNADPHYLAYRVYREVDTAALLGLS